MDTMEKERDGKVSYLMFMSTYKNMYEIKANKLGITGTKYF
jgi:hypothetical protein